MEAVEIRKILKAARELGVTKIKLGDFEAEFPPIAGKGAVPSPEPAPASSIPSDLMAQMPPDDQMLLAATSHFNWPPEPDDPSETQHA